MKFFIDNNLPPRIADGLNQLSLEHEVFNKRRLGLSPDTPDIEWITRLGREGAWAVITQDAAIRRNVHEREALRRARLTTFCLAKGWIDLQYWPKVQHLVKWWPTIEEQAIRVQPGIWFRVPIKGRKMSVVGV